MSNQSMLKFNVITLFPNLFEEHFNNLPFRRAIEKDLIEINLINLRDFAVDARGTVDDKPYGGGVGMILKIEPIYNALQSITDKNNRKILLAPSGQRYTQQKAQEFAQMSEASEHEVDALTIICGRYEGVDARVENLVDEVVSIGDFVLSGGELAALAIMESITRLIPGVLEKEKALKEESFTTGLEHPQYTRPEEFKRLKVPEVLLSGNHKEIEKWKSDMTS